MHIPPWYWFSKAGAALMPRPAAPEMPRRPIQAAVAAVNAAPDREEMATPVPAVPNRPTMVQVAAGVPMKVTRPGRAPDTVLAASASVLGSFGLSVGLNQPQERLPWGSMVNAPDAIIAVFASFQASSISLNREHALIAVWSNASTLVSYWVLAFAKLAWAFFCLVVALMPIDAAAPRSLIKPIL